METARGRYVTIFDTTLRDGGPSHGATLRSSEKLKFARAPVLLRVGIVDVDFPAASPDDPEAMRRITSEVGHPCGPRGYLPIICGSARATQAGIDPMDYLPSLEGQISAYEAPRTHD